MTETLLVISLVVFGVLVILECVFLHTKSSSQEKHEETINRLQAELTVFSLTQFGFIGSIFLLFRIYEDILLLVSSVLLFILMVVITFMYAKEMEGIWRKARENCEEAAREQMAEWYQK